MKRYGNAKLERPKRIRVKYFTDKCPRLKINNKGEGIDLRVDSVKSRNWGYNSQGEEVIAYEKGDVLMLKLGVAMELPEGYYAELMPRSSTFHHWGLIQTNSVGLIDNSYCGDNDEWAMQVIATRDSWIKRYDRVAQFTIKKYIAVELEEVEMLENEDRGGYGTSGK